MIKTERIQAAVNLPETIKIEKNIPAFKKGDTIKAEVLVFNGENITIKTSEGKVFSARIISGLPLNEGDNIELFVADKSVNGLALKIVSAEPDGHAVISPETGGKSLTDIYGNRVLDVLTLFCKMGIKPVRERLDFVFYILKQNPPLDLRAAVFLSMNGLTASQENISMVNAVVKGGMSIGGQLAEIINEIAGKNGRVPETVTKKEKIPINPPEAQKTGGETPQTETLKEANSSIKTAQRLAAEDIGEFIETGGGEKMTDGAGAKPAKNMTERITSEDVPVIKNTGNENKIQGSAKPEDEMPEAALKTGTGQPGEADNIRPAREMPKTHIEEQTETVYSQAQNADKAKEYKSADIVKKALSAFIDIKDANPVKLKDTALNTFKNIISLKEMAENADIKEKAYLTDKIDETCSLMKLLADIDRFYCLHIPVCRNGALLPAELYIYKRRKKGGMIDAENTVLVLGLDTANIGRVEAVIRIENRNVTLVFRLNHGEAGSAIKQKAVVLHKGFRELGYNLAETQVKRLEKRTTAVDAEEELISAVYKTPVYMDYRI